MEKTITKRKRYQGLFNFKKVKHCQLRYDVDGDVESISKTHQEFGESTNINNIVNKYKKTGILSSGDIQSERKPMYGDYSNIDYVEVQRKIAKVQEGFEKLSAVERESFGNKPEKWLEKLETDEITSIKKASDDAESNEKTSSVPTDTNKTGTGKTENKATTEEKTESKDTVSQTS